MSNCHQSEMIGGFLMRSFNPRSREGSDRILRELIQIRKVSIHAPAKGATVDARELVKETEVSIHAPAKGATAQKVAGRLGYGFQSTLPRRERRPGMMHTG